MMGGEINNCAMAQANNPGNWVCWPSASPLVMVPQSLPAERPALQSQNHQKHGSADKRQACKTEKNLKFLLQKVLKQSDVGNLGRIVLPKLIRGVKVRQNGPKSEGKKPTKKNLRKLSSAAAAISSSPVAQAVR
ncbi:hypothetical protein RND71_006894 [Anisodus tanguticus]|uniref:Uncharacterized protein n=1 Tax=Anisodus tanguticus TaxID=243964 RepID=A0AAE1SW24_9SOLA|nr:hypothetical protein RND71_006894 [Anisodus tanguticus]